MQPFYLEPKRVDAAQRVLSTKWADPVMTDEKRLMVMWELGANFYDQTYYDEDGNLNFNGTDLQLVAVAAAFAALIEAGAYLR